MSGSRSQIRAKAAPVRLRSPSARCAAFGLAGFTLIEMMAVVLFTAIVLVFAVNFYIDLSNASRAAMDTTREGRRAATLLDRVARDLEATVLVKKPEELDPLAHPWLFVAESRNSGEGADRFKFVTRGRRPRSDRPHESDLEMVSYFLRPSGDDAFELYRWSSPRLPESLERDYPNPDSRGAVLLADGVASFGVRFLGEEGSWQSSWDSTTIVESSELPVAAEIAVAFHPENELERGGEPEPLLRQVRMPVRPLDLVALLEDEEQQDEEQTSNCGDGMTVNECVAANQAVFQDLFSENPTLAEAFQQTGDACWADEGSQFDVDVACQ